MPHLKATSLTVTYDLRARKRQSKARGANLAKLAVLHHLGAYCRCCNERDITKLCVEHVNGDGKAHRLSLPGNGSRGGLRVYADIIRKGYPPGYSVLCRSCNSSKGTGKVCRIHGRTK